MQDDNRSISMFVLHVHLKVKPEFVQAFLEATKDNAQHSVQEPGCLRFDILHVKDDPTRFVFNEVYRQASDLDHHRTTEHYQRWRDAVPDMMAEPRQAFQLESLFPPDEQFR